MCRFGTVQLPQNVTRLNPQNFRKCNAATSLIGSRAPDLNSVQTVAPRGPSMCKEAARAALDDVIAALLRAGGLRGLRCFEGSSGRKQLGISLRRP
jgi:hypothetical protein